MSLPRTLFRPILLLLALSLGAMTSASAQTRDVAGAKDYPGIGRFGGSVITGYQVKDFDAARMQGAAFKDGQPTDARRLEGRITRIAYRTNPGPSILEVSRNFETQLAKAGFETLLACDVDACGGIPFSEAHRRAADPADVGGRFQLPLFCRAQGGRRARDLCQPHRQREQPRYLRAARRRRTRRDREQDGGRRRHGQGPRRDRPHRALRHLFRHRQGGGEARKPPDAGTDRKAAGRPAAAQRLHRRPHRQPGRLRLQSRSVAPPRRGGRRRAGEELSASRSRGCAPPVSDCSRRSAPTPTRPAAR